MVNDSVYSKLSPWASNQERLVTEALIANTAPAEEIQTMVRPPLPQIQMFPALFGYGDKVDRTPTIDSVIGTPVSSVQPRIDWSGSPAGYMGSPRFVNGPV